MSRSQSSDGAGPELIRLAASETWSCSLPAGTALRCARGAVWVTQAGDARDHVLTAERGETFTPARKGKVVVQALTDIATMRLERAGAVQPRHDWLHRRRRATLAPPPQHRAQGALCQP